LVINYSVLDPAKAISILEDLREQQRITSNDYYLWFVYLNLAVLHFDQGHFKEAMRYFTRLSMLDWYKNAGPSLRLKIDVAELINRFELQQHDVIEYRMNRIRKEYKDLLADENHYTDREMLEILRKLLNAIDLRNDKKLLEKIDQFILWTRNNSSDDGVIIDYANWLRTRFKN
jgi:tetratricopeptide (TPR) repeat protein